MKISARDRILLGVVAAVAVLAGFYLLALKPQRDQASRLDRSIASAQKQLVAAQSQYASGRAAEQRLNTNQGEFAAAQRAVPQTPDVPALLKLLQRMSDEAHVSINTISLSGSSSGSSAAAPTASTASTSTTVPLSLTFGGGYQALNRMVRQLDTLVVVSHGRLSAHGPLVGISSVSLSPGSSTGSGGAASTLSVQLSATIYQTPAASASGATPEGTS